MASKTISVRIEAYEKLRRARRYPGESFSEVILRAAWPEETITADELVSYLQSSRSSLSGDALDRIEAADRADKPPEDKWTTP